MSQVKAIVQRATDRLNEGLETPFEVAPAALERIVQVSGGFPWFVHVVSQEAFMLALAEYTTIDLELRYGPDGTPMPRQESGIPKRPIVTDQHVSSAVRQLPTNRFAQKFKDQYQSAVRDSYQREVLLRVLARWRDSDIPTADTYAIARKAGVQNPSIYKGHLMQFAYGDVLVQPPHQARGVVRFRNEMFKRYVDLRPSVFAGAKEAVDDAYRAR